MKDLCHIVAAIVATTLAAASASALELKYNNFMPPRSVEGIYLPRFAERIQQSTGGAVSMRVFSGGQLLGGPATLGGIRDGVVDVGFIVPTLNPSELRHLSMIPELLPFARDPFAAAAAADQTIMLDCPECRKDLAQQNAVWLGGFGPSPWHLMCRDAVRGLSDMKDRKVRVTGGMSARMIAALGGVGVQMAPPEIGQAIQRGQIDCAAGPIDWMIGLRLTDSVKHVVDHNLGIYHGLGLFVMNRTSLAKLNADQRSALKKLMPEFMAEITKGYVDRVAQVRSEAASKGTKFTPPAADFLAALEKFKQVEIAAVADDMRRRGVENPERLVQMHLKNLETWHKKIVEIGGDPAKYADALRTEIYDKVDF
jgi:TRAP-type C4-dicarboxylate transport system substrate-binding protein